MASLTVWPVYRLSMLNDGTAVMVMFEGQQPIAYRPLWRAGQGRCVLPHEPAANDR